MQRKNDKKNEIYRGGDRKKHSKTKSLRIYQLHFLYRVKHPPFQSHLQQVCLRNAVDQTYLKSLSQTSWPRQPFTPV